MGITYQVTDVEGAGCGCVLNERRRNDCGIFLRRVLGFCDETPLKPAGSIELKTRESHVLDGSSES